MANGTVSEHGTFEQLMASGREFKSLMETHVRAFADGAAKMAEGVRSLSS